ncbi:MAG: hypothetical protein PUD17_00165 [Treponema sp.]|uniref:HD domain-containing protein n=1 Tax=Treponema sp. TaxID=166 RepID=UPI00298E3197|nr:hypothetical protein [Treponema sp.]MDD5810492.1 hypothetical protein [Treponema sp.]
MSEKVSILEIIEQKSASCDENKKLWQVSKDIIKSVVEHSKQISSQMSEYDIHDERHSEKVIEIMEHLLVEKIEKLSFYELILLYLSAYLHDSGMALPNWEYDALRAVEGCDKYYDSTLKFSIKNDFKSPQTFDEIKRIVRSANLIDYNSAKNYIFIENSEDKVVESISKLIFEYETFRNRYVTQLKEKNKSCDYIEFSKVIRSEFIRITHHKKAVNNIKNLKNKIETAISPYYTNTFLQDLENICQAHGDNLDFIKKLPKESEDWENNKNNIQFLALILRLGDIIHFSSDRAPLSLYSEKQISNEESLKHWKVKFQDIKYNFSKIENQISISFQAFCSEPEMYYFLTDYINGIDEEINNFYRLKQTWEKLEKFDVYNIILNPTVLRDNIKYDRDVFIPDEKMKFTLNQSKILNLLMGVQLYKDKFACLRELYQNALDTSKCLLAYNKTKGVSEKICIEFGIGEENLEGRNRKYIYCLDHGLGMDKYIVENYLLHIGNSYYKSRDFDAKNTDWKFDVKPTSQFGIGILSCYMIADKLGVTSIYYENQKELSFVLSGISERFYYKTPQISDKEKIGSHGTLIKLFLKDSYAEVINADYIPKMSLFLMERNDKDIALLDDVVKVKNNLFYILFNYIGIPHSEIQVCVNTTNSEKLPLYQYNQVFDYTNYEGITKDDIERLVANYHFFDGHNPYKKYIENIDFICNYVIETKTDNITLYTILSLPKKGITADEVKLLNYADFIGNKHGCLCIDGISVEHYPHSVYDFLGLNENLLHYSLINFSGEKKPILSVDRTSCIQLPKLTPDEVKQLRDEFILNIENQIKHHIRKEQIDSKDREFFFLYEFICSRYFFIASKLVVDIATSEENDIFFPDDSLSHLKIADLVSNEERKIENVNFQEYQEISRQILLGKCINSDLVIVHDDNLYVKSSNYTDIPMGNYYFGNKNLSLSACAIRADTWEGKYNEYDLVSSLWPIVNPKLFDKLSCISQQNSISSHCKLIDSSDNAIQAIARLNPTLINPKYGIGYRDNSSFNKDNINIGNPDKIAKGFWLFELSNHGESEHKEKKSPTLFVYIAPRKLNDLEESLLKDYEQKDNIFAEGIRNGWSIYFLGAMQKYIIVPGIISRSEIELQIPESFKKITPEISYFDTNNKQVL